LTWQYAKHKHKKKSRIPLLKPQKTITVEKLFKDLQNRPIIELFKFFGWATTPLCGNLDQSKPKTNTKLYKISQSRPMIVNFLIFQGGPWPTLVHEGLCHRRSELFFSNSSAIVSPFLVLCLLTCSAPRHPIVYLP